MRGSRYHNGIDIGKGFENGVVDVVNMYSGTVIKVDYSEKGYGYYVDVKSVIDGEIVVIRYAHFHENTITVKEGDNIMSGKDIGKMGSSGNSTGPHVHIEVQVNPPNGVFSFANVNGTTNYNPNSTNPSNYISK
jgi:murein DD-endopeptidase MepM/ murein hydrolase activator NlpD